MKEQKKATDYKKMFMLGLIFVGTGIALTTTVGPAGIGLLALGGIMMFVGGQHRDEWQDD